MRSAIAFASNGVSRRKPKIAEKTHWIDSRKSEKRILRDKRNCTQFIRRLLNMKPNPGTEEWYGQVAEDIIEPDRPIIDPHHHLWFNRNSSDYLLEDLWRDTESGHKIEKTVFIECSANYHKSDPDPFKPVVETEFAADIAMESGKFGSTKAVIAAIVSYADLTKVDVLDEVLQAHDAAGKGLFRGIRHAGAHHPHPEEAYNPGRCPPGLFLDKAFQDGVRLLGRRGHPYESWHYHTQLRDFYALARTAPDTTIILDHFGTPLGTKSFRDRREEIFQQWQSDIALLVECPNVFAKLGGLAMPDNGFGWHNADRPATSDELCEAQGRYYHHAIECFGVDRCMFESNFPVDKLSISYAVLWNAFKKIPAGFSEDEKHALFYDTAAKVYRLLKPRP